MATTKTRDDARQTAPGRAPFWRCLLACTLLFASVLFFNGALGPSASAVLAQETDASGARDASCLVGAAAFIALGLAGMHRPRLLSALAPALASAALVIMGQSLTLLGECTGTAWAGILGTCLTGAAGAWIMVLLLLACSALDLRSVCLCLAGGLALANPLALGVGALTSATGFAWLDDLASALANLGVLALCQGMARPFFARLEAVGVPADREVSHPDAFLPLRHRFFAFVLVFSLAYGFAVRTLPAASRTVPYALTALVVLVIAAWTLAHKDRPKADDLFQLSFVLVVAGFSLALVGDARCSVAASAALVAGYMCFYLLMWFVLCAVAARSAADAVPAVCWGGAVNYLGILLGALIGGVVGDVAQGTLATQLALAAVLCAMASYLLCAFHSTSLDAAIDGIEPDPQPLEVRYVDQLAQRCDEVAQQAGLTAREREMLLLLARGNNGQRIQEELSISHNTVKYHARNIYRKLGVHSQQSLIDLLCG